MVCRNSKVDHRPLVPILNTYSLDAIENPRLQRIVEKMSSYNFDTTWRKGTDHVIPDTLSRHPVSETDVDDLLSEAEELSIQHIIVHISEELITVSGSHHDGTRRVSEQQRRS